MLLGIRWGSLRIKIIAWSFIPTAIILGIVASVIYIAYQQVTEDLVIERNRDLMRLSASQLNSELEKYTTLLNNEARRADIHESDPVVQREALKGATNRLADFDAGVLLLDTFGTVVAAQPERPEILGHNWSDRTYYRQVLRSVIMDSPSAALSNIVADGPDGAEVVAVAVPVTGSQGQFVGLLVGMFRTSTPSDSALYGDIARLRIGESGSAYIVDGNGRLVYHSNHDQIGKDISDQAVVQQVLAGQIDTVRTRDLEGRDIVASFAPVPGTSWGLITQESWQGLIKAGQGYRGFLLLLLVLGMIIPALVVAVGVRRLTRPISDLIQAAREVAGGNFGQTIGAETGDEIEELADQFNVMSAKLQASYTHLEQRVATRTRELEALNAIATVVSQSLNLDEILNAALDKTLQVMEIEAGGIYLFDKEATELSIQAQQGLSPTFIAGVDRLKIGEGFSGRVVQSGQPLVVTDVASDPRLTRSIVRHEGLHSLAVVPLGSKGKVLGTLFAASHGYREFTGQDIQLLSSIGNQIGVAVDSARLFLAEQRRAEQFRVITEVGHRITSILDIDQVLVQIVHLIQGSFKYDHVAIALVEGDEAVYQVGAGAFWDDPEFDIQPKRLKVGGESVTGRVAATGEPVLVPDVSQQVPYAKMLGSNTRSELAVPIKFKGQVIGVLDVQSDRLNAFDESDSSVLQSLANQAATAIENAWLFKAEQRRAEQFRVISKVGRRITSILTVDEMLAQLASLIHEAFGYYHVGIGLVEGDQIVSRAEVGASAQAHEGVRLTIGQEGVWGWVAHTGEPLLVPDTTQEPRHQFAPKATEIRSQVCVPLKTKEAVIGVLGAESDQVDAFDESDLVVLQSLAQQAAFAIENARFFRDTTRQVRELRALADASRIISSELDRDQLLQALYEQIRRIAPTDFYLIALYDQATNMVGIEINVDEGVHYPKEQYELNTGLLEVIIHQQRPLRFDSLPKEKQGLGIEILPTGGPRVNQSWLGVPMLYGENVLGAIVVGSYQRSTFDEGHEQTLTSIANQAAVALENARLYKQAQQLAVIEERQRLARELHDAVTQTLFSASLIAEALPELWESDRDEGEHLLRELRQLNRGALAEMRTLLLELRPSALAEASLEDLLRQLGEAVTGRTGAPVEVTVEGHCALPPNVHVTLYRIAQEAMNNIVKHARAFQIDVRLSRTLTGTGKNGEPRLRAALQVGDDGCGFDPSLIPSDRLGLGIIRERAEAIGAELTIESQPGLGTKITIVWEERSPSLGEQD
jgi:GAF domain-containing protein/HAMP domain-containing protein